MKYVTARLFDDVKASDCTSSFMPVVARRLKVSNEESGNVGQLSLLVYQSRGPSSDVNYLVFTAGLSRAPPTLLCVVHFVKGNHRYTDVTTTLVADYLSQIW